MAQKKAQTKQKEEKKEEKKAQPPASKKDRGAAVAQIKKGRIYVTATFNNTMVTITDANGNVLAWGSSGSSGFQGARRATPYAATKAVTYVLSRVEPYAMQELEIYLKGAGSGREAALRALKNSGLKLSLIADITPIPHNGVRPKKKRRV